MCVKIAYYLKIYYTPWSALCQWLVRANIRSSSNIGRRRPFRIARRHAFWFDVESFAYHSTLHVYRHITPQVALFATSRNLCTFSNGATSYRFDSTSSHSNIMRSRLRLSCDVARLDSFVVTSQHSQTICALEAFDVEPFAHGYSKAAFSCGKVCVKRAWGNKPPLQRF